MQPMQGVPKGSIFGLQSVAPEELNCMIDKIDHTIAHFSDPKTPKSSGRSKRRERKLTYDWHREIKLNSVLLPPLYRIKGDLATKRHPGYKQTFRDIKEFCTGSTYEGNYNALGFAGVGEYIYPHGVIYNGYFKDGQFHGKGTLTYPMGQQIDGIWKKGRLVSFTFRFADGLEYSSPWKYCQQPNRCFQSEIIDGLHPAGKEYLTNQQPTKKLQDGCYDTVDGYFNPVTKCVYKDDYGDEEVDEELSIDDSFHEKPEILRVCTKMEEDFIVPNYRKAADDSVGYRPNLYEHWTSGIKAEIEEITKTEKHVSDITLTTLSSTESDTEDYDCSTFDSTSIHNSLVYSDD